MDTTMKPMHRRRSEKKANMVCKGDELKIMCGLMPASPRLRADVKQQAHGVSVGLHCQVGSADYFPS